MSEAFHENLALAALLSAPLSVGALLYWIFGVHRYHERHYARRSAVMVANTLAIALVLSLAALGGELYFRFVYDTTDAFGVTKTARRWLERHYAINATGMRDDVPAYSSTSSPGRPRITFLGDSFTAGYGVPDVGDRFANRVRAQRTDWEILVFAVNGWDTGDQLRVLQSHPESELDRVVLVYTLNDISDIDPRWQAMREELHETGRPQSYLTEHSFFLNWLHYRFMAWRDDTLSTYFDFQLDVYHSSSELWREQRRRLLAIRNLVHQRGGRLLVVTFPFLHSLGSGSPYREAHEALAAFWKSIGVPHLDLLDAFEVVEADDVAVNAYDAHPNEDAHAIAGNEILSWLQMHVPVSEHGVKESSP